MVLGIKAGVVGVSSEVVRSHAAKSIRAANGGGGGGGGGGERFWTRGLRATANSPPKVAAKSVWGVRMRLVSVRVRRCGQGRGRHLVNGPPYAKADPSAGSEAEGFGEGGELGARGIGASGSEGGGSTPQGEGDHVCRVRTGIGRDRLDLGVRVGVGLGLVVG